MLISARFFFKICGTHALNVLTMNKFFPLCIEPNFLYSIN